MKVLIFFESVLSTCFACFLNGFQDILGIIIAKVQFNIYLFTFAVSTVFIAFRRT